MIDNEIIENRLGIMMPNLAKLKRYKEMTEDNFLSNFDNAAAAKYYLQTCVEAMIDIGNHIIARKKLGIPQSNIETIEILANNDILSKENSFTYKKMIKFRNTIMHLYHLVDDDRVYEIIRENLGDFDIFIDEVKGLLK